MGAFKISIQKFKFHKNLEGKKKIQWQFFFEPEINDNLFYFFFTSLQIPQINCEITMSPEIGSYL